MGSELQGGSEAGRAMNRQACPVLLGNFLPISAVFTENQQPPNPHTCLTSAFVLGWLCRVTPHAPFSLTLWEASPCDGNHAELFMNTQAAESSTSSSCWVMVDMPHITLRGAILGVPEPVCLPILWSACGGLSRK